MRKCDFFGETNIGRFLEAVGKAMQNKPVPVLGSLSIGQSWIDEATCEFRGQRSSVRLNIGGFVKVPNVKIAIGDGSEVTLPGAVVNKLSMQIDCLPSVDDGGKFFIFKIDQPVKPDAVVGD